MTSEPDHERDEAAHRFLQAVADASDGRIELPRPRLPPPPLPPTLTAAAPSTPLAIPDAERRPSLPSEPAPHPSPRRGAPLTWLLTVAAVLLSGLVIWWTELMTAIPGAESPRAAAATPARPSPPRDATAPDTAPSRSAPLPVTPRMAQATRLPQAATATRETVEPVPPSLRLPAELTVAAGGEVPIAITIEPAVLANGNGRLTLHGLPAGTQLSAGQPTTPGGWALAVSQISGLKLTTLSGAGGRYRLEMELRSQDDVLLAAAQTNLVVVATSPPPTMADSASVSEATAHQWLEEGKRLIGLGRIAAARLVLERAADNRLGEAALVLGDTYDPARLYALGVIGMTGDIKHAIRWYERADELGEPMAKARLSGLTTP